MSAKPKSKNSKAVKAKNPKPKANPPVKKAKATPVLKEVPQPEAVIPAVRKETKLDTIIQMLSRPDGATVDDMVTATGWQKHTLRSALSHALAKKRGFKIESDKTKGEQRIYKIAN